jgi:DNA-binding transcriptional ArsR family regulator
MESMQHITNNPMIGGSAPNLDAIFSALSDPTRRSILSRLAQGEASVQEIAQPFQMSQPAISKHLKVLEKAGLIARDVDEQRRPARLNAQNMAVAAKWLDYFKKFWGTSFDQLDELLIEMKTDMNEGETK